MEDTSKDTSMKDSRIRSLSSSREEKSEKVKPEKEGRLRRGIYLLPNLITSGALFAGFYSIISSMSGSLVNASIAIGVAALLDALDGRIARLTHTESEFGTQYDSLSDMVAFGVAPAVLMFNWILSEMGNIGWVVGFLYMACAALRLARFNTQPDNSAFTGLASPAAAGVMAATVWTWLNHDMGTPGLEFGALFAVQTAFVALLMVSNITYYSPKTVNLKGKVPFRFMLGFVCLLAVVFIDPPLVLLVLVAAYCVWSPVKALLGKMGFIKNKVKSVTAESSE